MSKCYLCSPASCAPHYLYVVWDDRRGLVKIGCSKNLAGRLKSYRANGATHITQEHKRIAGCWSSAIAREDRAIRLLDRKAERVQGDWFRGDVAAAIACVEAACAGYKGARWA